MGLLGETFKRLDPHVRVIAIVELAIIVVGLFAGTAWRNSKDEQISAKEAELSAKDGQLGEKDEQLKSRDAQLREKSEQLASKDEQLASKNEQAMAKAADLESSERHVATLQRAVRNALKTIGDLANEKSQAIKRLKRELGIEVRLDGHSEEELRRIRARIERQQAQFQELTIELEDLEKARELLAEQLPGAK